MAATWVRAACRAGRDLRRHCRAVDRRAWNTVDHAYLPRGGTASRVSDKSRLDAKNNGFVRFINLNTVESRDGTLVAMNRSGSIAIQDERGREKERYQVVYGARLKVRDGEHVKLGQVLQSGIRTPIRSLPKLRRGAVQGLAGRHHAQRRGGRSNWPLALGRGRRSRREAAACLRGEEREGHKRYLLPRGAHLMIQDGDEVGPGDVLAKIPKESTRTKDITGGLPRVVELFEAASRVRPRSSARSTAWFASVRLPRANARFM